MHMDSYTSSNLYNVLSAERAILSYFKSSKDMHRCKHTYRCIHTYIQCELVNRKLSRNLLYF